MMRHTPAARTGITLTEILISILILGIGLVSLATLFPIGIARLRTASRSTRSGFLGETTFADIGTRNLFAQQTFTFSWYGPAGLNYNPWVFDPLTDPRTVPFNPQAGTDGGIVPPFVASTNLFIGPGVPVAYDPLWWAFVHQSTLSQFAGNKVNPVTTGTNPFTAWNSFRFGSGIGFVRNDPNPNGGPATPSAHGLQRVSNFAPIFNWALTYPDTSGSNVYVQTSGNTVALPDVAGDVFTARDDVVFQGDNTAANSTSYNAAGINLSGQGNPISPDMSAGQPMNDWLYSSFVTAKQSDVSDPTVFDGNIVICNNRPLGFDTVAAPISGGTVSVPTGERVVEAIFGYGGGAGGRSNRVVTLRWPDSMPDPDVRAGGWIADVTYERLAINATGTAFRFSTTNFSAPPQRCYWYQVAKRSSSEIGQPFTGDPTTYRQMIITLTSEVQSKTPLQAVNNTWEPAHVNAALVMPSVINVFPRVFFVR